MIAAIVITGTVTPGFLSQSAYVMSPVPNDVGACPELFVSRNGHVLTRIMPAKCGHEQERVSCVFSTLSTWPRSSMHLSNNSALHRVTQYHPWGLVCDSIRVLITFQYNCFILQPRKPEPRLFVLFCLIVFTFFFNLLLLNPEKQ